MSATERTRIIWIIDSEQWPRACLRAELIERGYDTVGFAEIKGALSTLRKGARIFPDVIVLELRGQEVTPNGLQALREIEAPLIALGGSKELNDPLVQEFTFTAVLKRPVKLGKVADVIDKICSARTAPNAAPPKRR
jgi:DNA-binding NtrC family response regulator